MKKIFAIQRLDNGQVFDYCETREQASHWLNMNSPKFELVPTNTSSIIVTYTELGGPHGYGHQEESFATYGGIRRCIINLYKWVQRETSIWGPDLRDIKDYFKNCHVSINGKDKTEWFLHQIDKMKGLHI
jgi:hypothetical protein